jgi:type IV pilus assembly protein PilV
MNHNFSMRSSQQGAMLLEALVAIVIFSMGILAIVGMQAAAVNNSAESKYRSDANLLANQLLGQMWVSDRTPTTLKANFQGGAGTNGAAYTAWLGDAATDGTVIRTLPGAATSPPVVTVDDAATVGLVSIVVYWQAPSDTSATPHKHTVVAQIR